MPDAPQKLTSYDVQNAMFGFLPRVFGRAIQMPDPDPIPTVGYTKLSSGGSWGYSGSDGGMGKLVIEMSDAHKREIAGRLRNLIQVSPSFQKARRQVTDFPKPADLISDDLVCSLPALTKFVEHRVDVSDFEGVFGVMEQAYRFARWDRPRKLDVAPV